MMMLILKNVHMKLNMRYVDKYYKSIFFQIYQNRSSLRFSNIHAEAELLTTYNAHWGSKAFSAYIYTPLRMSAAHVQPFFVRFLDSPGFIFFISLIFLPSEPTFNSII